MGMTTMTIDDLEHLGGPVELQQSLLPPALGGGGSNWASGQGRREGGRPRDGRSKIELWSVIRRRGRNTACRGQPQGPFRRETPESRSVETMGWKIDGGVRGGGGPVSEVGGSERRRRDIGRWAALLCSGARASGCPRQTASANGSGRWVPDSFTLDKSNQFGGKGGKGE